MGDEKIVWLEGLAWVEARRDAFALPRGPIGPSILPPLKAIGELARMLSVLRRLGGQPVRLRLDALFDWAFAQCREGALFFELLETRPSLLMAGALYSIFDREGYRHGPTRELVAQLGLRPPSPVVDAAWTVREASGIRLAADAPFVLALGLAEGWKAMALPCRWSVADLVPRTILGRRPEGSWSVDAGYSVAHAVLFATAFGADPEGLDSASRVWLRCHAPAALEGFLAIPNLDVYSELALALCCTGPAPGGASWEAPLASAQRPDGSLPAPVRRDLDDSASSRTSGGGGPNATSFRRDYHVTLAAILASASLRSFR